MHWEGGKGGELRFAGVVGVAGVTGVGSMAYNKRNNGTCCLEQLLVNNVGLLWTKTP